MPPFSPEKAWACASSKITPNWANTWLGVFLFQRHLASISILIFHPLANHKNNPESVSRNADFGRRSPKSPLRSADSLSRNANSPLRSAEIGRRSPKSPSRNPKSPSSNANSGLRSPESALRRHLLIGAMLINCLFKMICLFTTAIF